ncbi:DNRLRE domain-containing protein [Kitasatospora sp. NPDC088783]|uniref:DNRLRE domain-containing protein n=1 Tax=Kitasatospora sp. NPDC088783 TaxID=3364077 RepID=UPI003811B33E
MVESTRTGFEQYLRLKDRSAVTNGTMSFTLKAKGLKARALDDGSVEFTRAQSGEKAGSLPAPTMWDAQTDLRTGQHTHRAKVGLKLAQDGDLVQLTLTPDAAFLADPGTAFPVIVDPAVDLGSSFDTYVLNGDTTDESAATQLNIGNDGTGKVARSFLSFPVAAIAKKHVLSADLNLYGTGSWSCTPNAWEIWSTGAADTATRWTNQPTWGTKYATSSETRGFSGSCGADWTKTDVTALVSAWAVDGSAVNHLGIRAADEGVGSWKTFASGNAAANPPSITVTYNTVPGAAVGYGLSPWSVNGYTAGTYTTSATPTLWAKGVDADGAVYTAEFEVTPDPAAADTTYSYTGSSGSTASGVNALLTVPTANAFPDGKHLRLRTRIKDGTDTSAWSAYSTFAVDTTRPASPTVNCSPYAAGTWSAQTDSGADCALSTTASDGQGFVWGLDDESTPTRLDDTAHGTGGHPLTLNIKPGGGWHTLYVRTVDAAGNRSLNATAYAFGVGADGAALLTPGDGERSAARVSLTAKGRSDWTGVTYEYRIGETDTWKTVPAADVSRASDGSAVSWPLAGGGGSPAALNWNITSTVAADGPVDVRAKFTNASTSGYSQTVAVTVDRLAGEAPGRPVGPGSVNMLTGDFTLSATDASAFGLSVARAASSRQPSAGSAQQGQVAIFGPQWTSGTVAEISGSTWVSVEPTSATSVALTDAAGSRIGFTATSTGQWKAETGSEELQLSGSLATSFTLKDTDGVTSTFAKVDAAATAWTLTTSYRPTDNSMTTVVSEKVVSGSTTLARPKYVLAPTSAVTAATCATTPSTKGCRVLEFVYANSTNATDSAFGDFTGRVRQINLWATSPDAASATSETIAQYTYDATGRLRETWDPRISPVLKTSYGYDGAGRVTTLTPPGELAWSLTYGKAGTGPTSGDGMLLKASRSTLVPGTASTVNGSADTSLVYGVRLSGSRAPYPMAAGDVAGWGQKDAPTDATALFPAGSNPVSNDGSQLSAGDYARASIVYTNASGREVNAAQPGGHISTTQYDRYGNRLSSLSAANREVALGVSADDRAAQLELGIAQLGAGDRAELLETSSYYSQDGARELETFGPLHRVQLTTDLKKGTSVLVPAGTTVPARAWTVNEYDTGRPADASVSDQLTLTTSGLRVNGYDSQQGDTRVHETQYDWAKGLPNLDIVDSGGLSLGTQTGYNAQGKVVSSIPPGGTDTAVATSTVYWSAAGTGWCKGRPEWADLPCWTGPDADITGGGTNPSQKADTSIEYGRYGQMTKTIDTANGASRTVSITSDAAGRPVQVTQSGGSGQAVPTTTTGYDPLNGKVSSVTSATGGTVTKTYDKLGRILSYQDADGATTTSQYDALDRLTKVTDAAPSTTTYTYDTSVDPRGLLTQLTDSVAGTFSARYNADGDVVSEQLPGGYTLSLHQDSTRNTTGRTYTRDSDSALVMADSILTSIHNQVATHIASAGDSSVQRYTYDRTGRLTEVRDTLADQCTLRTYTLDKRANRIAQSTATAAVGAVCPSAGTAVTHTYDSADRLVDAGYTYDAFGRATAMPGSTITYYGNDLIRQQTAGSKRQTWTLDSALRQRSATIETNTSGTWSTTATRTNHFSDDTDAPRWVAEDASGTVTRNVHGIGGKLMATTANAGGVVLLLSDFHGDITLQLPLDTSKSPVVVHADEYGKVSAPAQGTRYGYLGTEQRSAETPSGAVLMGVRVYSPEAGRFLSNDPVPGGSCSNYDYVCGDPVNNTDLGGDLPNGCASYSKTYNIYEGSVNITVATIHMRAEFCTSYGRLTSSRVYSWSDQSYRAQWMGWSIGFWSPWPSVNNQGHHQWISSGRMRACLVKYIPICGYDETFDMRVDYYGLTYIWGVPARYTAVWSAYCTNSKCKLRFR